MNTFHTRKFMVFLCGLAFGSLSAFLVMFVILPKETRKTGEGTSDVHVPGKRRPARTSKGTVDDEHGHGTVGQENRVGKDRIDRQNPGELGKVKRDMEELAGPNMDAVRGRDAFELLDEFMKRNDDSGLLHYGARLAIASMRLDKEKVREFNERLMSIYRESSNAYRRAVAVLGLKDDVHEEDVGRFLLEMVEQESEDKVRGIMIDRMGSILSVRSMNRDLARKEQMDPWCEEIRRKILVIAASGKNDDDRYAAVDALGRRYGGLEEFNVLVDIVNDRKEEEQFRRIGIRALGAVGKADKKLREKAFGELEIILCSTDEPPGLRKEALRGIENIDCVDRIPKYMADEIEKEWKRARESSKSEKHSR